ncbi:MAG: hypothetical protein QXU74_02015 [Candidatus Aenigmatarchaeota archaeon]
MINKMKNLLYFLRPIEAEFSFSGRTVFGVNGLERYSDLDKLFREFERRIEKLGLESYIPENAGKIQEIVPKKSGSINFVYCIEKKWFRSKWANLFYMVGKAFYGKGEKVVGGEFEVDGVIFTDPITLYRFKKALKSVFVLQKPTYKEQKLKIDF